MTREWKPGDVASIPFSRGWVRCIYTPEGWVPSDNNSNPAVKGYNDVRPLVVIDPEDREQVERLMVSYWTERDVADPEDARLYPEYVNDLQAALREFANPTPPKPDEPQGLGAVVEDEAGANFTRVGVDCWVRRGGGLLGFGYAEIKAVRVLSEGVS